MYNIDTKQIVNCYSSKSGKQCDAQYQKPCTHKRKCRLEQIIALSIGRLAGGVRSTLPQVCCIDNLVTAIASRCFRMAAPPLGLPNPLPPPLDPLNPLDPLYPLNPLDPAISAHASSAGCGEVWNRPEHRYQSTPSIEAVLEAGRQTRPHTLATMRR